MRRFLVLTKAMTLIHLRNRSTLFWNLAFPVFLLVIYSQIFGAMDVGGTGFMAWVVPGVVVFRKKPGDRVEKGESVAEVVDPLAEGAHRVVPLASPTTGVMFARRADRFARPGLVLAKIAGREVLKAEGENLLTI